MAGLKLTPFQFSSNLLQNQGSIGKFAKPFGNIVSGGIAGDTYQTAASWYEMWINPTRIQIEDRYIQNRTHTAGSIVTFHYRQDVKTLTCDGSVGWVQIQSDSDSVQSNTFNLLRGDTRGFKQSLDQTYGSFKTGVNNEVNQRRVQLQINKWNPSQPFAQKLAAGSHGNKLNNSPRKFLQRLKDLADQPPYYTDDQGLEHYNVKYIKMYTKQFPTGVICEGYFTDFSVPESAEDAQTVQYSFTYIIENMKPVTIVQRVAGMYTGTANIVNGILGAF
jgi:hypothetical protein